ncbi:amino acid adenylation domain-containing protein [Polaromonas hydrogenivorans]|uniref:Amino acid adenylation domain-containing protein n=1 Tax=Polaromonas hydrogenivorans TaxID=335476 RepID=A0AAU7LQZ2_9BURK
MTLTSTRLPASSAQYGIWMGQQMAPESPSYLTAEVIELRGALNLEALSASVADVLNNCHTLHMRFQIDDEGLWQWPQTPCVAPLAHHDFRHEADPEAAAQQWIRQSLSVLCDPTRDPLYRSALLQVADEKQLWYLQVHHIAMDGFGYGLICQAVAARYSARVRCEPLPPLADWSLDKVLQAEQTYKANGKFQQDKAFWTRHLQQVPAPATIAAPQAFSDEVTRHGSRLSLGDIEAFQQAAQRCGQDWGSWMLAAIGLWLAKQSAQRQLTFGLPVMNRLGTPALGVPCMAMNIVPMSVYVDPDQDMQALSAQLAGSLRSIRPHLYYRYGWIRGDLGLMEVQKHLFNQAVNLMPFDRHAPFEGLESAIHPVSAGPVKDLNISLSVLNTEWRLLMEANPNAYSAERLAALQQSLLQWLRTLAAHPAQASLAPLLQDLPPLSMVQGPALTGPVTPVIERLIDAAASSPGKPAIESDGGAISYAELLQKVRQLAARLGAGGLGAQQRVVILLPRSPEAIIAILATLWAGGCYVPLDPLGPSSRLETVLADADPQQIITLPCWAGKTGTLPALYMDQPCESPAPDAPAQPPCAVSGSRPAYLLYTSGSTGKPNGVLVGHGALAHFVASSGQLYQISASDRILQFAPLHFDASIEEIFLALCHGATLVLRNDAHLDSIPAFTRFVEKAQITILDLPTAYWHELAHALEPSLASQLSRVRLTIVGGEAALPERARRWQSLLPDSVLLNSYGPTEASVIATSAILSGKGSVWDGSDTLPIGLPRPGVEVLVVDEHLYPVAQGKPGELLICGEALALGYRHDEALTARRFVSLHSRPDAPRAYRTGDRACLQDGQLVFLGRLDHEVKISGLRIDPAEVENALLTDPAIREVAVVAIARLPAGYALAAFVVGSEALAPQPLRRRLADLLPAAAIPDHWHFLDSLPRNVNGKIDRQHLAGLISQREIAPLPGATALEQQIMQVWHDVLGEMPDSVHANFFDLGGKSLQAIQVSSRLGRALKREVAVSALFNHATVHALAKALSAPAAHRPPPTGEDQAFAPLLTIQRGSHPALFCLHPAEGLSWCYLGLARHLPDTAIYGLQATGVQSGLPGSFDALVDDYLARIRQQQASGPYRLLGWSLGGALAQAIAVKLSAIGEQVELVALMDSYPASAFEAWRAPTLHDALVALLSVTGEVEAETPDAIYQRLLRPGSPLAPLGRAALGQLGEAALHGMQLFRASQTACYRGDMLLFHAAQREAHAPQPSSWLPYLKGKLDCVELNCNHFGMSDPVPMACIGKELAERLKGKKA